MEQMKTKTAKVYTKTLSLSLLLNSYLEVKKTNRNLIDIILWWESKRITFNIILFSIGFMCIQLSHLFLSLSSEESIYSNHQILACIILSNAAYSLSCVSEFFIKKDNFYAPKLFKNGLLFCIIIALSPTLFHFFKWLLL